ncbi:hypothetical protein CSE6_001_00200 [Comamonas sp. E6]|nr:hypothetical protein CSE6_001_00200 [Comamonas sp. E6]
MTNLRCHVVPLSVMSVADDEMSCLLFLVTFTVNVEWSLCCDLVVSCVADCLGLANAASDQF